MRLEIRSSGVKVTEELRIHLVERLRLALGRFARYIGEVWVYLRDMNGPRGGVDKECRIVVEVPRAGRVVVTGADAEVTAAITRTASRAGFAVRRHVKRRLARRRRGHGVQPLAGGVLVGAGAISGAPGETEDVW